MFVLRRSSETQVPVRVAPPLPWIQPFVPESPIRISPATRSGTVVVPVTGVVVPIPT